MRLLGSWQNPTVFGLAQLVSVFALSFLYIWKAFRGGKNPLVAGNPFDSGNALYFPRSQPSQATTASASPGSVDWGLSAPADLPIPAGLSRTSCGCKGK